MGSVSFDLGGLVNAASKFEAAGQQSAAAGQQLTGISLSPAALGSQGAGSVLANAIGAAGQQHAQGAAAIAAAHEVFAGRLRKTAELGEQSIALSTQAASY